MTKNIRKFLFTTISIIFLYCMLQYVLVIKQVVCTVQEQMTTCPGEVKSKLSFLKEQPLLFSELSSEIEKSLSSQPFTLVTIARELPTTIRIELSETEYNYGIATPTRSFVITTDQVALEKSIPSGVPTVFATETAVNPNSLPDESLIAVNSTALSTLSQLSLEPAIVHYISPQELKIELQERNLTVIVNPARVEREIRTIPIVLNNPQFKEIPEPVAELDMRFDMPVIRTALQHAQLSPVPSL